MKPRQEDIQSANQAVAVNSAAAPKLNSQYNLNKVSDTNWVITSNQQAIANIEQEGRHFRVNAHGNAPPFPVFDSLQNAQDSVYSTYSAKPWLEEKVQPVNPVEPVAVERNIKAADGDGEDRNRPIVQNKPVDKEGVQHQR